MIRLRTFVSKTGALEISGDIFERILGKTHRQQLTAINSTITNVGKMIEGFVSPQREVVHRPSLRLPTMMAPLPMQNVVHITGFMPEEKAKMASCLRNCCVVYSAEFTENVTHVVSSKRVTMMGLRALISGRWLLSKEWILTGAQREGPYGTRRKNLLTGKRFFISEGFLTSNHGAEIANELVSYGSIRRVDSPHKADYALLGYMEPHPQCLVCHTVQSFLISLPFPNNMTDMTL